jgi:hypothetical protein
LKCDFGEVDEAMFELNKRTYEQMCPFRASKKSEMDEVAEVMYQVGEWR